MAKRKAPAVNLNQPLSDQPWWVKTIVWVGVPTAAFGYLLYFVLGDFKAQMVQMNGMVSQQQTSLTALITHLQQETEQSWVLQSTISQICINTARTDADRLACVSVVRRPQ